jgi:hypothetical protein
MFSIMLKKNDTFPSQEARKEFTELGFLGDELKKTSLGILELSFTDEISYA